MDESKTTHIVEVVAGEGDPPRLPLALGLEQSPFSVGRSGMWQVVASGVLDAHAFLYFDGQALFVQSADATAPALANGAPVDTSWTEVAAPCTIELGGARIVYREIAGDEAADHAPPSANSMPLAENSTVALAKAAPKERPRPPIRSTSPSKQAPPLPRRGPSKTPPPNDPPRASSPRSMPPALPKDAPPSLPPFKPFPSEIDDSTRVAPLEASAARAVAAGTKGSGGGTPTGPSGTSLLPTLGSGPLPAPAPSSASPVLATGGPFPPTDAPAGMFGGAAAGTSSFGREASQPLGSQPLGVTSGSPAGPPATLGAAPDPGASESFVVAAVARGKQALTTWRSWPLPRKAISVLLPLSFIAAGTMLLEDDPPPPKLASTNTEKSSTEKADTSETEAPSSEPSSGAAQEPNTEPSSAVPPAMAPAPSTVAFIADWPAEVPCPPPNWPADRPPPCTPNDVSWTPPSSSEKPAATTTQDREPPKAAPIPAGTKTLERQAVDLYAAGDYLHAAEKYDELAAKNPSNRTYSEAARIARARASGKSP